MSVPKTRNRMVVFRLTQEEYENLRGVCSERGGRSLSDFTRSELMNFLGSDSLGGMIENRFSDVRDRLGELQDAISRLTILVSDARKAGEENA
jgi:hypothetical protein